jgi:NAD(P)-dependent dehydrogenase (short-subunit alcohol dehydrogenase family)
MTLLQGRVALITGAQRGVGYGIAQEMIGAGAAVVITDIDSDGVERAAEQLGQSASGYVADVTDQVSMQRAIAHAKSRHGHLDAVIANAGVGSSAPLGEITEDQFDFIYGVNVKGVLFTIQAALPDLRAAGGTAVIIGSTASTKSEYGMSLYGGSKAALRQMVRTWIGDLRGSGVRLNIVSPGAIDTPSLRNALAGSLGADQVDARVEEMGNGNPIGRLGTPRDIGKAVVFLCSEESSFVTGVEFFVDGGMAQTG